MSSEPGGQPRVAILAAVAAVVLFAFGFYPLPTLVPGYSGVHRPEVGYWLAAGLLTVLPILVLAALPWRWVAALPRRLAAVMRRPSPPVFALLVGALFTGLSVFFSWYAFHHAPITADDIAQLWQARILLHGHLALPSDPNFQFFAVDNVIDRGAWYSQYPIGGPLVLALGYLMHVPWLLDPLLGGLTAMALYHFARRAYGETQGRAAALLFTLAPVTLLMSASYMNHVPVLLLTVGALAALTEWERAAARKRRFAIAAGMGLALGFMAAIRPLDALVVAVVVGVFQLVLIGRARDRWPELAIQALFAAVGVAPLLIANHATTGSAFRFGYSVMWGPAQEIGFHVDPFGVRHTPLRAVMLAARYVSQLNSSVVGWPVPALLVAIVGLLSMRRISRWDGLLFGLFGAQVFAYALYWHNGQFLGPRFLYTAMPAVMVLLARTPFLVAERWDGYWRRAAPLLVLACVGVGWLAPTGREGAMGIARQVRHSRLTFKLDLAGATRAAGVHHALVFVHEPFSGRLIRRLWGVGFSRGAAERAFARGDACSVLEAVRAAEADTSSSPAARVAAATKRIVAYRPGPDAVHAMDPSIHITSVGSLTPACKRELASDARFGAVPFGLGLLLEPIGPNGRLNGDVIYATDLGDRDQLLRSRFGDRTWYRTRVRELPDGSLGLTVVPYQPLGPGI